MRKAIGLVLALGTAAPPLGMAQSPSVDVPAAAKSTEVNPSAAVLRPGDVVRITVWRKPELSGEFEVAADGTVRHPLYRRVQLAGVPLPTAESRLRSFLEEFESNPHFVIEPLLRVAIAGEVRQPNLYALPPETTIAQAVAYAGGLTDRARPDRVHIVRDGGGVVVDLADPGGVATRLSIRSGDQIVVDRRTSVFRDYVAPVASIAGAIAAVVNVYLRTR